MFKISVMDSIKTRPNAGALVGCLRRKQAKMECKALDPQWSYLAFLWSTTIWDQKEKSRSLTPRAATHHVTNAQKTTQGLNTTLRMPIETCYYINTIGVCIHTPYREVESPPTLLFFLIPGSYTPPPPKPAGHRLTQAKRDQD